LFQAADKLIATANGVVVVVMAAALTTALFLLGWQCTMMEILFFPQPTEHVVHHHCCCQPQQPQSDNGCSSLPSQHKADCCVDWGQIVDDSLFGLSSLSLLSSSLLPLCVEVPCVNRELIFVLSDSGKKKVTWKDSLFPCHKSAPSIEPSRI
jgi:hypothetical protein